MSANRDVLRIHDAHRILGPVPHDTVSSASLDGLLADLDSLGVASCSAVSSWQLFGDPSGRNLRHDGGADPLAPGHVRVRGVPVVVPGATGPAALSRRGHDDDVRLVRACPMRHRWSLDSGAANRCFDELADQGCAVSIDASEVGFPTLRGLAANRPGLTIVVVSPGYRELRRCAELLEDFDNTFVETGSLNTSGGIEWLAGVAGAERLLFGSGGPLLDDAGATYVLRSLELPDADVERIAYGTAAQLGLVTA